MFFLLQEKQSKWKKSNDFKAEFFDHQNNLMTESLLNRKSPLLYLDLNRRNENERKNQPQMSSLSPNNNENLTTVEPNNKQLPSSSSKLITSKWIDNSIHEPTSPPPTTSFIRPHSSGLIKKPRPRSACLDNTYMLR